MGGRRRALTTVMAVVVVLASACGGGGGPKAEESSGSASPSAPQSTAAYAVHTVDAPGKRTASLVGDDVLVVGDDTLPDDLVDDIEAITVKRKGAKPVKAVDTTMRLSFGYTSVEGEQYDVAAADLDDYRRFTSLKTADFDDQWKRLAGGEFAAAKELQSQLPLDDKGYLPFGSGDQVHLIHLGAWADQAAGADLVVNTAWGRALGLPEDNALLISTGGVAPQALKKPLLELLGEKYSVQDLDAVAEYGLDIDARQVVQPIGTFGDAVGTYRYRVVGDRVYPEQSWVRSHIVTETVPILGQVTCNKYMLPQMRAALIEIVQSKLADEIHKDEYAGCYYPRFIAGSSKLSNHAFGLAFDINVPGNQRGTAGQIHRGVVDIFKKWGFAWGGDWSYTDPMHFELREIVKVK